MAESIGGIWKKTIKTSKGDVEILSISLNGKRYTAWPNSFKKDKQPDYRIQEDNYEPKNKANEQAPEPISNHPGTEDDLPF
jgi:hypothetical protein